MRDVIWIVMETNCMLLCRLRRLISSWYNKSASRMNSKNRTFENSLIGTKSHGTPTHFFVVATLLHYHACAIGWLPLGL